MWRRVREDNWSITNAAAAFGFSRPSFYEAQPEFEHAGLSGFISAKRWPREANNLSREAARSSGLSLLISRNPAQINDRLLLGMKGILSELESHVLTARLHGGIINKARRGELTDELPIGLVHTEVLVYGLPTLAARTVIQQE